jgi:hypothetical protein
LLAVEVAETGRNRGNGLDSGLTIAVTANLRIEVARGFDARTLQQLLRALEQR